VFLPELTGRQPVPLLKLLLLPQRLYAAPRQRQGPPRLLGLGVVALAIRTPHVNRESVFACPARIGEPTDVHEAARIEWVPLAWVAGMITAGDIWNAGSLTALLRFLMGNG
jgi:hypothetical protein